ncbi:MAG TPA: bifunctional phosphopantothenoylcysteine decarboxylase/phosphopantothenate--cysteine ligase CoaBC [Deltaproteobacteria bacterium]|nr:bifunctional phosphopantothenoylcysteine decarboxylase/phosphopantothenate--cysteine ligase CoaBC [Deltaproteobacteria bacterium]
MAGRRIVLGVTGGIAAYKALELARLLRGEGVELRPVMTRAATEFITPLSLATLAGNPVLTGLFESAEGAAINHIELAESADLIVIAPATANVIGKIACGIADDLLTTVVMASKAPVLFAPAMNHRMYENPIVEANVGRLEGLGYRFVGPAEGELACGYEGRGRLAPVEDIMDAVFECLSVKDLAGEKVLVTAGATREMIDPVRFISNASSGKMGFALARAAKRRGAEVVLVSGPTALARPHGIDLVGVTTAEEMYDACVSFFPQSTVVVMAAAVSDYRPVKTHARKVKKDRPRLELELERTKDILKELAARKKRDQTLVGFALETEDHVERALEKLREKSLDLVVANSPSGISSDTNEVTIIDRRGGQTRLEPMNKFDVADRIFDEVARLRR